MFWLSLFCAFADRPTAGRPEGQLQLGNQCNESLRAAVMFKSGRQWRVRGTYLLDPGTSIVPDLVFHDPQIYLFAWSASHTWVGTPGQGGVEGRIRYDQTFDLGYDENAPGTTVVTYVPVKFPGVEGLHAHNFQCAAPVTAAAPEPTFDPALVRACQSEHNPAGHAYQCLVSLNHRADAVPAARACNQLDRGQRMGCYRVVGFNYRIDGAPAVESCIASFGRADAALDCIKALDRARDSAPLVQACAQAYTNTRQATQCLEAAQDVKGEPWIAIQACGKEFPTEPYACIKRAAPLQDAAFRVQQCAVGIGPDDAGLDCLGLAKTRFGFEDCITLFDDPAPRLSCLERANELKAPADLSVCGQLEQDKDRLRCVSRGGQL